MELKFLRAGDSMSFADEYEARFLQLTPLTPQEQTAREVWACYWNISEQFDRTICSSVSEGIAMPTNGYERSQVSRHALVLRAAVFELMINLGIPHQVVEKARQDTAHWNHEELEQMATNSVHYPTLHSASVRWRTPPDRGNDLSFA